MIKYLKLLLGVAAPVLALAAAESHTNRASAAAQTSSVSVVQPPGPPLVDENAMRELQRLTRSRTREAYPGSSYEAQRTVETARDEQRAEGPRAGSGEASNAAIEVSGAMTARGVEQPAGATNAAATASEAQRAAQKATEGRKVQQNVGH